MKYPDKENQTLVEELKEKLKMCEQLSYEYKEKTTQLKESAEVLRYITASAKDAVVMADGEGRVSFWNESALTIFGYTMEEAIGKPLHELIIPERFHGDFLKGFRVFSSTGAGPIIGRTLEVNALRKGGAEFYAELSVSAVMIKDMWHSIGIVRDISERKKLEDELKIKLDELERVNRLMVGRELKMEELRKEIRQLRARVERKNEKPQKQK